jgi:hypothetical protein
MKKFVKISHRLVSTFLMISYFVLLLLSSFHFHNFNIDEREIRIGVHQPCSFFDPFVDKENYCSIISFQNTKLVEFQRNNLFDVINSPKQYFFLFSDDQFTSIKIHNQSLRAPPIIS